MDEYGRKVLIDDIFHNISKPELARWIVLRSSVVIAFPEDALQGVIAMLEAAIYRQGKTWKSLHKKFEFTASDGCDYTMILPSKELTLAFYVRD